MQAPLLIASSYVQLYLRAAEQPVEKLLAGTGLTEEGLGATDYIDYAVMARLYRNVDDLGAEPGWAARTGEQLNISTHGPLAFAALSAPTLGAALGVMAQLHATRTTTVEATELVEEQRYTFVLRDLTGDPAFAPYTLETIARVLQALIETVIGHPAGDNMQISFSHRRPPYADVLQVIYRVPLVFDAARTAVSIPASWLHIPSPLHDESSYRQNCAKCREIMARLTDSGDSAQRVRNILASHFEKVRLENDLACAPPGMNQIAEQLHTTPRTLIRRLKAQDTSYRRLLDEARLDCADALLADARLTVAEVAQRLGYSDPANFGRAFRNLTGMTPAAWRRR